MSRKDSLDLISQALFDPSVQLSEADAALMERLRDAYTFWLEKPTLTDLQMRDYMMTSHGLSRQQALNDLSKVKLVLGNVTIASKEFFRHKVNDILDKAFAAALSGQEKKAKALVEIAKGFICNNRTDEDDGEKIPFDQIVPKDWSFTVDPRAAGVKPVPGIKEKAEKLRQKYIEDIEITTDFEEIPDDGEEY